jgi:hypothetical protein
MKPTLIVTSDFTKQFNDIVKKFKHDAVLVGIPESDEPRKDDDPISNAALLAIANFGSPMNNIPPWPIMATGIANAKDEIADQFKNACVSALKNGFSAVTNYYERAGIIASVACKKVINDQEDVPSDKPEQSTLDTRKARGFKGRKYWLVTGQMRNAITYVVRGSKR